MSIFDDVFGGLIPSLSGGGGGGAAAFSSTIDSKVTIEGLDNVNVKETLDVPNPIKSELAVTKPIQTEFAVTRPIETKSTNDFTVDLKPIETKSTNDFTVDLKPIETRSTNDFTVDLKPVALDLCLNANLGTRLPQGTIRQPWSYHLGLTWMGLELLGLNFAGEMATIFQEHPKTPQIEWPAQRNGEAAGLHPEGAYRVPAGPGLRVRVK